MPPTVRQHGHIAASGLAYAHPGGDVLFEGVSFKVAPGRHVGLVGANGVGKSTLLKVLAGELAPLEGDVAIGGGAATMAQDVGADDGRTVRELLLSAAPAALRRAGTAAIEAERVMAEDPERAGMALGAALGDWAELGGYELEGQWDAACRRIVRAPLADVEARPAATLSGGERKQLVLDVLLGGEAPVLLLDEPDNFLDVPAKRELERRLRETRKTVLVISHDRDLLTAACDAILTLEGNGAWLHGGSYATYPEAREERQRRMGDAVARWHEEERRLRELVRTFKERARYSPDLAKRADAYETRWRRWADAGPPPAPVTDVQIRPRLRGGDSGRVVLRLDRVGIDGLVEPFEDEVRFGERIGIIGPNGSGKTHLLRRLAEDEALHGARVSAGRFTQLNARPEWEGRSAIEVVEARTGSFEKAMQALARYRLAEAARRPVAVLSGGQKARLEVLGLELDGHNLLLLDEPTDNLDIDSSEALETALDGFEGTVVAVSHDRAFLRRLDRFWHVGHDGRVDPLPDPRSALERLGA
jgi:ATPase subunit of ABC transporter with duplicated ATPase domains